VQVGVPYLATWAFGDPHQAATGTIPDFLSLRPQVETDGVDHSVVEGEQVQGDQQQGRNESRGEAHLEAESFRSVQHSSEQRASTGTAHISNAACVSARQSSIVEQIRRRLRHCGVRILRWLMHARQHGYMTAGLINLGYEVAYLLKISPYFSPAHHISGLVLVRDDGKRAVRYRLLHFLPSIFIHKIFSTITHLLCSMLFGEAHAIACWMCGGKSEVLDEFVRH
jgi:hypothetical protein